MICIVTGAKFSLFGKFGALTATPARAFKIRHGDTDPM
jgi:hypothetical protein